MQQPQLIEKNVCRVGSLAPGEYFREMCDETLLKITSPGKVQIGGGKMYDALCVRAEDRFGYERILSSSTKVTPVSFIH